MVCITLLSDFGSKDASVAITKGILMQHTTLPIIDITHEITPYHTQQAAYLLHAGYRNFSPGCIHIILSDLFSEKSPRLVLCYHRGHYFLAPDNGVIPLALSSNPEKTWLCKAFDPKESFSDWLFSAASVIKSRSETNTDQLLLPESVAREPKAALLPDVKGNVINCDIVHIDRYENVVINVTRELFDAVGQGRLFRLQFMRMEEINELTESYTDVREGYKLCRFNSSGYLEICINRGRAASLFGLRLGGKNNHIKLSFE
jgi:S-adenosylmethionine hydrolase